MRILATICSIAAVLTIYSATAHSASLQDEDKQRREEYGQAQERAEAARLQPAEPLSVTADDIHFVLVNNEPYTIVEFGIAVSASSSDWLHSFRSTPPVSERGVTWISPKSQIEVAFERTGHCIWDLGVRTLRNGSPHDETLPKLNLCKIDQIGLFDGEHQSSRDGQPVMDLTGEPARLPTRTEIAEQVDACVSYVKRQVDQYRRGRIYGDDVHMDAFMNEDFNRYLDEVLINDEAECKKDPRQRINIHVDMHNGANDWFKLRSIGPEH